jgi:phospholipase C
MVAAPILARRTPPASPFYGGGHTGSVNNLINTAGVGGKGSLLTNNPNRDAAGKQVNPRRLDPANINDILTCDQDHGYGDEQKAFHGSADGKTAAMDQFITSVGTDSGNSPTGQPCQASDVMNYYDGNTVTGLWNYASQFAMSDSSFGTTFGPSSPRCDQPRRWNDRRRGQDDQRRRHRRRHRS